MTEKETLITKLERGRAEFAYNCVKEVKKMSDKIQKDYRSYVRRIPQMILSNGLGQTLAFIYSKKKSNEAYNLIYKQLTNYLKSDSVASIDKIENELVEEVISYSSTKYRYVTQEVLAFLNWLRRFAEGMIEAEGGE